MNSVRHQILMTAEWISDYAQSIEAPVQTTNGNLIAPSTMPIIFWQAFDIPWLSKESPCFTALRNSHIKLRLRQG